MYLLEEQAAGVAFGHTELPYANYSAVPGGDDCCGGWAHGTQTAAPVSQVLECHQDLQDTSRIHTNS